MKRPPANANADGRTSRCKLASQLILAVLKLTVGNKDGEGPISVKFLSLSVIESSNLGLNVPAGIALILQEPLT